MFAGNELLVRSGRTQERRTLLNNTALNRSEKCTPQGKTDPFLKPRVGSWKRRASQRAVIYQCRHSRVDFSNLKVATQCFICKSLGKLEMMTSFCSCVSPVSSPTSSKPADNMTVTRSSGSKYALVS